MGDIRNGSRTALDLMAKVCKLSRLPGFRAGMATILGEEWTAFQVPFDALCLAVDALIAADNFYNKIDFVPETTGSEDLGIM
jgi:hypothetical protein